jgi:hypothetical protein
VRRPRGKERSAVIALKPDLDRWLHEVPQGSLTHNSDPARHQKLHRNTEQLLKQTHAILERSTKIQEMVKGTMALTLQLKARQAERIRERVDLSRTQHLVVTHTVPVISNVIETQSQAAGEGAKMDFVRLK